MGLCGISIVGISQGSSPVLNLSKSADLAPIRDDDGSDGANSHRDDDDADISDMDDEDDKEQGKDTNPHNVDDVTNS